MTRLTHVITLPLSFLLLQLIIATRAEDDTKAQQEIIKILIKEKEDVERLAGANKRQLDAEEENKLYLPGEKEALKGTKTKIFSLYPSTRFENDAATIHFR